MVMRIIYLSSLVLLLSIGLPSLAKKHKSGKDQDFAKILTSKGHKCDIVDQVHHEGEGDYAVYCLNSTKTRRYHYYVGRKFLLNQRIITKRGEYNYPVKNYNPLWQ